MHAARCELMKVEQEVACGALYGHPILGLKRGKYRYLDDPFNDPPVPGGFVVGGTGTLL